MTDSEKPKRRLPRTAFNSETAKIAAAKSPQHKKGWKTKARVLRENAELIAAANQMTPLQVLQGFANDELTDSVARINAASAAAPYVHRKLPQAVELSGDLTIRKTFAAAVGAVLSTAPDDGSGN